MKNLIVTGMLSLMAFPAVSEWQSTYVFYGLGLSDTDALLSPSDLDVRAEYVPQLSLGMGKTYRLDNDWVLDTELSVEWASAHARYADSIATQQGDFENLGVWATSRLMRENWIGQMSPFVELGVGKVRSQYSFQQVNETQWATATKARVGMQFSLSDDKHISISLGTTEY